MKNFSSAHVKLPFVVNDKVVYTSKSGDSYSATITAITTFGVAIRCATGERFFEEKRSAVKRCVKFPAGALFFVTPL